MNKEIQNNITSKRLFLKKCNPPEKGVRILNRESPLSKRVMRKQARIRVWSLIFICKQSLRESRTHPQVSANDLGYGKSDRKEAQSRRYNASTL
jgi:hypothetical protein